MNNHHHPSPTPNFTTRDRLNKYAHPLPCTFLEWSGWYTQTLHNRLIGHHHLYTNFKKNYRQPQAPALPANQAYVLHYRSSYPLKYLLSRITTFLITFVSRDNTPMSYHAALNHHLIHKRPEILAQFLTSAETDLTAALDNATIATLASLTNLTPNNQPQIAIHYNDNRTRNEYHSQVTFQPILSPSTKGKEKGVFSKKQLLILFDLLSETSALERIDLQKPNKFPEIATLLHAISGKPATSFLEFLTDHRYKTLYHYQTSGERTQLIITLTNLAETFRAAGFRSIAKQADKKIRQLENSKIE